MPPCSSPCRPPRPSCKHHRGSPTRCSPPCTSPLLQRQGAERLGRRPSSILEFPGSAGSARPPTLRPSLAHSRAQQRRAQQQRRAPPGAPRLRLHLVRARGLYRVGAGCLCTPRVAVAGCRAEGWAGAIYGAGGAPWRAVQACARFKAPVASRCQCRSTESPCGWPAPARGPYPCSLTAAGEGCASNIRTQARARALLLDLRLWNELGAWSSCRLIQVPGAPTHLAIQAGLRSPQGFCLASPSGSPNRLAWCHRPRFLHIHAAAAINASCAQLGQLDQGVRHQ
jgi:hypothetical protein